MTRLLAAAFAAALLAVIAPAEQPAAQKGTAFQMTSTGKLTLRVNGKDSPLVGETVCRYTWRSEDRKRVLLINSITGKAALDGREFLNGSMSRSKVVVVEDGKAEEIRYEDAPEDLRKVLRAAFDSPVCTIQLDAAGREVKRMLTVPAEAAEIVDREAVAATTLFHPWYAADKDEWQSDVEWGTGNGVATGRLTYKKVAGGKGGQAVRVSGELAADGDKDLGEIAITKAKFKVTGEQTYDAALGEWIAGKITADVTCQLAKGKKPAGEGKGTVVVSFELLPAKK